MEAEPVIRQFIAENFFFGDDHAIGSDDSLLGSGVIDSTGVMELVLFLEETFHVEVADEEIIPENLDSIRSMSGYVERKLAAKD
jgi:acyl carrier protein